ncbi:MAG TPA: hypothetical protein VFM71_05675 [Gemmatimonadaceae bacterium]|nr:hypothetical protein [Gemmatimonadaceae bacterium]
MEELIGRYFFIVVVIFATVMDLVGRWYKNRQRRDRQSRRTPEAEPRAQVDWRKTRAPEPTWRQTAAAREREDEPVVPRERATGLPDFAQILLEELGPPASWTEVGRAGTSATPIEQPMIARVVPKTRHAAREAVEARRQEVKAVVPSQAKMRAGGARLRHRALGTLRAALDDPAAARRAVVLAEVLGPCRAAEPYGQRR